MEILSVVSKGKMFIVAGGKNIKIAGQEIGTVFFFFFFFFFFLKITELNLFYFIFWPWLVACRILVPQPDIDHMPSVVKVWSLNHWTAWNCLHHLIPQTFSFVFHSYY